MSFIHRPSLIDRMACRSQPDDIQRLAIGDSQNRHGRSGFTRTAKRAGLVVLMGCVIVASGSIASAQVDDPSSTRDIEATDAMPPAPLLYRSQFPDDRWQWTFADPSSWRWTEQGTLELHRRESEYAPPHRSPLHMAMLAAPEVGSFRLDVEVRSTNDDYGHRDVCFFFGFAAPDRFYYAHLGKVADEHCNQIFLVDAADRTRISKSSTDGTPWDDQWHTVRIERNVDSGRIAVYFDDMTAPIMTAEDDHHGGGRIGIGSFDDIAEFRKVELWGDRR